MAKGLSYGRPAFSDCEQQLPHPDRRSRTSKFVSLGLLSFTATVAVCLLLTTTHSTEEELMAAGVPVVNGAESQHWKKFNNGMWVWTKPTTPFDPENREQVDALLKACTDPNMPINFIYLSNYKGGGKWKMWDESALQYLITTAHANEIKVYAVYTEWNKAAPLSWNFFSNVALYNKAQSSDAARFDGISMNWEGHGADGLDPVKNPDHWVDMYNEAKKYDLKFHACVRWWWPRKEVLQLVMDHCDSFNIMAYSNQCRIQKGSDFDVDYMREQHPGRGIYIDQETMAPNAQAAAGDTWCADGETAMLKCIHSAFLQGEALPDGYIVHFFNNSYSSGKAGWPVHAGALKAAA